MTDGYGRYRVLFVCTANICRSPSAELLARDRFGEREMVFRSAGFLASGQTCPPELIGVLAERGIDAAGHRSYRLDEASIGAADMLLTMESAHVQKATMLSAEAFPKTVPLKEAAMVAGELGLERLSVEQLLEAVNRDRDPRRYLAPSWDVDDPYGRRTKVYRQAVQEIDQLLQQVIGRLD